jgi:hypothetical protein
MRRGDLFGEAQLAGSLEDLLGAFAPCVLKLPERLVVVATYHFENGFSLELFFNSLR